MRKTPNGDVFQSFANGDVIQKKSDGHQVQVAENGACLFLVNPGEASIQIDLQDFSVIVVDDEDDSQIEIYMEDGFTLDIRGETRTKQFKDGCKVVVDGDGKKTQYNVDGSKIEFFPDGTRVDTSADGRVFRKIDGAAATKLENEVKVIPFEDEAKSGPLGIVLQRGMWDNKSLLICSGIVSETQADLCSALVVGDVLSKIGDAEITESVTAAEAMDMLAVRALQRSIVDARSFCLHHERSKILHCFARLQRSLWMSRSSRSLMKKTVTWPWRRFTRGMSPRSRSHMTKCTAVATACSCCVVPVPCSMF